MRRDDPYRRHSRRPWVNLAAFLVLSHLPVMKSRLSMLSRRQLRVGGAAFAPLFRRTLLRRASPSVCQRHTIAAQGSARSLAGDASSRQYVRLVEQPDGFDLATAQVRMVTDSNQTVTVAATMHIGDPTYFERLQNDLDRNEQVLYELVVDKTLVGVDAATGLRRLATPIGPSALQLAFSRRYGLCHQLEVMRMDGPGWFIADLDREEILALREQRLEEFKRHFVRGVVNPFWILAATELRHVTQTRTLHVKLPKLPAIRPSRVVVRRSCIGITVAPVAPCKEEGPRRDPHPTLLPADTRIALTCTGSSVTFSREAMEKWFQSGGTAYQNSERSLGLSAAALVAVFLPCPEICGIMLAWLSRSAGTPACIYPTPHPKPYTPTRKPETRNPKPETLNPQASPSLPAHPHPCLPSTPRSHAYLSTLCKHLRFVGTHPSPIHLQTLAHLHTMSLGCMRVWSDCVCECVSAFGYLWVRVRARLASVAAGLGGCCEVYSFEG
jgi:hypothetical protein